jgi:putative thioredoxin
MSNWVFDTGDPDFETAVIARSAETPVVVDFWAPWCGPCKTLGPLLERLADEHKGAFVLAKVNVDDNPGLSSALNIQSIPMVLGFRDRQVVAEFVGAVPEAAVREFLNKVLPSDAECLAASAEKRLATGEVAEAERSFQHALQLDTGCERALLGIAGIHANRGQYAEATAFLDRIDPGPWRQTADRLAAESRIREAGGGDEPTLRAKLVADPADLETRLLLAQVLAAASKHADALEQYLEAVRRDRGFRDGAARMAMLDIFNLLGAGNEIVDHYRSELAKVLFS